MIVYCVWRSLFLMMRCQTPVPKGRIPETFRCVLLSTHLSRIMRLLTRFWRTWGSLALWFCCVERGTHQKLAFHQSWRTGARRPSSGVCIRSAAYRYPSKWGLLCTSHTFSFFHLSSSTDPSICHVSSALPRCCRHEGKTKLWNRSHWFTSFIYFLHSSYGILMLIWVIFAVFNSYMVLRKDVNEINGDVPPKADAGLKPGNALRKGFDWTGAKHIPSSRLLVDCFCVFCVHTWQVDNKNKNILCCNEV